MNTIVRIQLRLAVAQVARAVSAAESKGVQPLCDVCAMGICTCNCIAVAPSSLHLALNPKLALVARSRDLQLACPEQRSKLAVSARRRR